MDREFDRIRSARTGVKRAWDLPNLPSSKGANCIFSNTKDVHNTTRVVKNKCNFE